MTSPFYAPLDPQAAPDPVTPHASPGDAAGFASVTPHGQGPAPYDIQAQMEDLQPAFDAAGVTAGQENAIYPPGPRQAQAAALLESPAGFASGGYDIITGFHEGGGDGWPNDVEPDTAGP